ncbi:MAG: hypothetical protein AAGK66_01650 [Pseudomonadota bacterium]
MALLEFARLMAEAKRLEAEHAGDPAMIAAVMRAVLDKEAAELRAGETVTLVSVTFDQLDAASQATGVIFETRVDRQTRTLIFLSGLAMSGGANVLKATAIYRIG